MNWLVIIGAILVIFFIAYVSIKNFLESRHDQKLVIEIQKAMDNNDEKAFTEICYKTEGFSQPRLYKFWLNAFFLYDKKEFPPFIQQAGETPQAKRIKKEVAMRVFGDDYERIFGNDLD